MLHINKCTSYATVQENKAVIQCYNNFSLNLHVHELRIRLASFVIEPDCTFSALSPVACRANRKISICLLTQPCIAYPEQFLILLVRCESSRG